MASIMKDKSKTKDKKKKDKGKGKVVSNEFVEDSEVDEPPSKAYQPPEGNIILKDYIDTEDFDYDALKDNDDLELWVIRVPEAVKPKHFENVKISIPSSSSTETVGTLSRKHVDYDIWSVRDEGSDQTTIAGGGEVLGLRCLVPRKRKAGSLLLAPKSIERYLVLTAQPTLPTPPPSEPDVPIIGPFKSTGRYRHPSHLLKHRFLPCGTIIDPSDAVPTEMEVDGAESTDPVPATETSVLKSVKEGRPEKKRKGNTESSKKKKSKATS